MMIVAVTLLSVLALLCLLAMGLVWMVIKNSGILVIDTKAVAILFKIFFHVEYRPHDRSSSSTEIVRSSSSNQSSIESPRIASISDAESGIGDDSEVT
jgi:hypothetical protein